MTAQRFGDRGATVANARLCYGEGAKEGQHYAVFADHVGWGWSALVPLAVRPAKDHGRSAANRLREAMGQEKLQPVAKICA